MLTLQCSREGTWADREKELTVEAGGESMKVGLVSAAISSVENLGEKGKLIYLVLEGLEMMIRLGWRDRKREAEFWHGGTRKSNVLDQNGV